MTKRWWLLEVAALFLLCASGATVALARLGEARAAHRAVAAAVAMPAPAARGLLPPGQGVRSDTDLRARLAVNALRSRILVERMSPAPTRSRLVAADVVLSGGEAAVLAWVRDIETGPPAVRLTTWRIDALPRGIVRLTGRAVAGW